MPPTCDPSLSDIFMAHPWPMALLFIGVAFAVATIMGMLFWASSK